MDYDVIYTDDERNADHRRRPGRRPGSRTVVVPPGARPTVITGGGSYRPLPAQHMPYYPPQQAGFSSRFGMTTGELIDTGIQLLAAITPLPAAPVALGKADDDVSNLITYQSALAGHAKRDEQLRTIGAIVAKLLA